jgi:acetyl-CoA carboxylase biotin carboxylase subunit
MFRKVLIANRGEIAIRIMRACREMGIRSVAVYSEADRTALHPQMADEAHLIGPPPATESYLNFERVLDAAKKSGVEAIHPGYGFLAENANFSQAVKDAGLVFIGPPAEAMQAMGSKTEARRLMKSANVPVIPGMEESLDSGVEAKKVAARIGYPVLLKAALGGGGKGMRIVEKEEDIERAFDAASREAQGAFGDGSIYLEKFLKGPRHIEFQILADEHGHVIHLGERECSIQRRHQKIIEETPSVALTPELRREMGAAAVRAARACGYVNAGTVECMLDAGGHFYFLEMNTRLQVEHPVTEMVTGIDLVKWQLRIAAGEKLSLQQDQIHPRGHAIEARLYAEDVAAGFLPSTGTIHYLRPPSGPGIREDSGMTEGNEVSRYYDPLMSKLIAWGENRMEAISRLARALREYRIAGVRTTIPFCLFVIEHPSFQNGDFDTRLVDTRLHREFLEAPASSEIEPAMAAALAMSIKQNGFLQTHDGRSPASSMRAGGWKWTGRRDILSETRK